MGTGLTKLQVRDFRRCGITANTYDFHSYNAGFDSRQRHLRLRLGIWAKNAAEITLHNPICWAGLVLSQPITSVRIRYNLVHTCCSSSGQDDRHFSVKGFSHVCRWLGSFRFSGRQVSRLRCGCRFRWRCCSRL